MSILSKLFASVTSNLANSRITRGMGAVGLFVLIGKFAGAGKEVIVAYRYGVSEIVDVYMLAYTLVMFAPTIWMVILAMTYVPISKRLSSAEAEKFSEQLTGFTFFLGGSFSVLSLVLFPQLIPMIWSEYSDQAQEQLAILFVGLTPVVMASFLASLYAAQLLALEKHSNTLLDGVPSLVLAFVILCMPNFMEVTPFIVGGILGTGLQLIGLYMLLKRSDSVASARLGFSSKGWLYFKEAIGFLLISQFVMSLTRPADLFFAAELGAGSVATYGYAYRFLMLGMTLGATASARALLPVLSDSDRSLEDSKILALKWSSVLIGVGVSAVIVGWVASPVLIPLLFERGAFTATDTKNVTEAVQYGLFQLPLYFAGMVLTQFAVSQRYYSWLLHCAILTLAVKLASGWFLSKQYGLPGLFFSSVLMYLSSYLYLRIRIARVLF